MQMTFEEKLIALWQDHFWDAIGCGCSESRAETFADMAVASARKARLASRPSRQA